MNAEQLKQEVLNIARKEFPNAQNVLKMDLTMKDKVMYAGATSITDYKLFDKSTDAGKDNGYARTHTFPLDRGKVYTIHGIRTIAAIKLSAVPSTTLGWNEALFYAESYFQFIIAKSTLNPIYLNQTAPTIWDTQGGAVAYLGKQNYAAYMFSEPIIVPTSGEISLTFKPTPGFATATAAGANPYAFVAGAGAERHQIFVELVTQEWTIES